MTPAEAAVQAMAGALCQHGPSLCLAHDGCLGDAEYVLAALVASKDVRAALVAAITSEGCKGWAEPDHEAGPAIRPWPLVDAVLAALTPGGARTEGGLSA